MLGEVLRDAAPEGTGEPSVVLLSDGPRNSAWWEHATIARRLGIPMVALEDLERRGERLEARLGRRRQPVDVVYRRTDEDRLHDAAGRPTAIGEVLLAPIRAGRLACVNAFGSGVADDKLVHAYVEEMIRFYLAEEPLVASVPTYDLGEPKTRRDCLARLDELVVKPRTGHGGHGVVIGIHADREALTHVSRAVEADPERYVAQETVLLSRHPTVCEGELVPRHVDLRPFVLSGRERCAAVPGGLTRVAFTPGSLVVNSAQAGGGKATWVLE
jgi:carboxylate-amine ligase